MQIKEASAAVLPTTSWTLCLFLQGKDCPVWPARTQAVGSSIVDGLQVCYSFEHADRLLGRVSHLRGQRVIALRWNMRAVGFEVTRCQAQTVPHHCSCFFLASLASARFRVRRFWLRRRASMTWGGSMATTHHMNECAQYGVQRGSVPIQLSA